MLNLLFILSISLGVNACGVIQAGASITVMKVDDQRLSRLDADCGNPVLLLPSSSPFFLMRKMNYVPSPGLLRSVMFV